MNSRSRSQIVSSVSFDVQFRVVEQRHRMQRIDVGNQVPAHAVSIDQLDYASFFRGLFSDLIAG